jgi:hypothetical protein
LWGSSRRSRSARLRLRRFGVHSQKDRDLPPDCAVGDAIGTEVPPIDVDQRPTRIEIGLDGIPLGSDSNTSGAPLRARRVSQ